MLAAAVTRWGPVLCCTLFLTVGRCMNEALSTPKGFRKHSHDREYKGNESVRKVSGNHLLGPICWQAMCKFCLSPAHRHLFLPSWQRWALFSPLRERHYKGQGRTKSVRFVFSFPCYKEQRGWSRSKESMIFPKIQATIWDHLFTSVRCSVFVNAHNNPAWICSNIIMYRHL